MIERLGGVRIEHLAKGSGVSGKYAFVEAVLHEAGHYVVAGQSLVDEVVCATLRGMRMTQRVKRISSAMFDRHVSDRLERASRFVANAEELDVCVVTQHAGVLLNLWSRGRRIAAANVSRVPARALPYELRCRSTDHGLLLNAEEVATWYRKTLAIVMRIE